eukprot:8638978-Ditylum_brightwellii.AAC.1
MNSCSDLVQEPQALLVKVTRQTEKKVSGPIQRCNWPEEKNFEMLKGAILNARSPKVLHCPHSQAAPLVPLTTLWFAMKRLEDKEVTMETVFP